MRGEKTQICTVQHKLDIIQINCPWFCKNL